MESSINTLKDVHQRGNQIFQGIDELTIAYEKTGYFGKFRIDAAGRLFENGKQVIIDGVEVIAKQF
jgi:hypothetical protein